SGSTTKTPKVVSSVASHANWQENRVWIAPVRNVEDGCTCAPLLKVRPVEIRSRKRVRAPYRGLRSSQTAIDMVLPHEENVSSLRSTGPLSRLAISRRASSREETRGSATTDGNPLRESAGIAGKI